MFFSILYFCKQRLYYYYYCRHYYYFILGLSVMAIVYPVGEVKSIYYLGGFCISHYLLCDKQFQNHKLALTFRLVSWLAQPHRRLEVSFRTVQDFSFWGPD